jgi:hypothetical protein
MKWKRFRPRSRGSLKDKTAYEPDSLYARAREIADDRLRQAAEELPGVKDPVKRANHAVTLLRRRSSFDPSHMLALLLLQAPAAAAAQDEMDKHHGGYRNRQARLYELIDFNDTFVDTVLSLPEEALADFETRLKQELGVICAKLHTNGLDDDQYEAIVHGLSREIAVLRGAQAEGYVARMTSRVQDAMGVDIIITDPHTKRSIGVDVKTYSAFHFRLKKLQNQHRIDEEKRLQCELAGFCTIKNGKGKHGVETVLVRIDTERLGPIVEFTFKDTAELGKLIASALKHHGKYVV